MSAGMAYEAMKQTAAGHLKSRMFRYF